MPPTDEEIRKMAQARVAFREHAVAYALVNAFLVAVWWISGDFGKPTFNDESNSYFWPIYPILGWGIGLAFHGWGAYGGGSDAIDRGEQVLRERYGKSG